MSSAWQGAMQRQRESALMCCLAAGRLGRAETHQSPSLQSYCCPFSCYCHLQHSHCCCTPSEIDVCGLFSIAKSMQKLSHSWILPEFADGRAFACVGRLFLLDRGAFRLLCLRKKAWIVCFGSVLDKTLHLCWGCGQARLNMLIN